MKLRGVDFDVEKKTSVMVALENLPKDRKRSTRDRQYEIPDTGGSGRRLHYRDQRPS